jgi:hypothetical protein
MLLAHGRLAGAWGIVEKSLDAAGDIGIDRSDRRLVGVHQNDLAVDVLPEGPLGFLGGDGPEPGRVIGIKGEVLLPFLFIDDVDPRGG